MIQTVKLKKIAFILYLAAIHIIAGLFVYEKIYRNEKPEISKNENEAVSPVVPLPTPVSIPFEANNLPPETTPLNLPETPQTQQTQQTQLNTPVPQNTEIPVSSDKLMIPVAGIKRENLQDTYTQSRSNGRVHNAADIIAPLGTPVVAVADGEIAKFFDSKLGGITIYQWSADKKRVYYYAHLQRRAENLQEKAFVKQGTVIGYVGDTGNSGAGNYHLHFSIIVPSNPNSHWDGVNLNPYPILIDGIESPLK